MAYVQNQSMAYESHPAGDIVYTDIVQNVALGTTNLFV